MHVFVEISVLLRDINEQLGNTSMPQQLKCLFKEHLKVII